MRVEQSVQLYKAEPLQPFRIHLADGRHMDAKHPGNTKGALLMKAQQIGADVYFVLRRVG